MPPTRRYHASVHLALILACGCLGYAEYGLLTGATWLAGVVAAAIAGLAWVDGRVELSLATANRVGLGIGVGGAAWLAYQFVDRGSLIYTLPWPASLLPYLGPLLMVLIPAKLVRPKHVGDWWAMHGIGLAAAGLACALADDITLGVLLGLYAAAAVGSLGLFFVHRSAGTLAPVPGAATGPPVRVVGGARAGWSAAAAGLAAAGAALPAFFLTPRSDSDQWQFLRPKLETGYSPDQVIDLNRAGDLGTSRDVAFEVTVTAAGAGALDPGQRWRGPAYVDYKGGQWTRAAGVKELAVAVSRQPVGGRSRGWPRFGPDDLTLDFAAGRPAAAPVLADPVAWRVDDAVPVRSADDVIVNGWYQVRDASFRTFGEAPLTRYRQVFARTPPPDEDLGPAFELLFPFTRPGQPDELNAPFKDYRVRPELPGLVAWARGRLAGLAAADPRVAAAIGRAETAPAFRLRPADFEAVARAFTADFAAAPEFAYSTSLVRADPKRDPVEEFVTVTKTGHCQRFAAALVLALRSVGVPAQYVIGFKGWDADPARPGVALIRQEHAHAWAEVLVPRPAPAGFRAVPTADRRPDLDRLPPAEVWHWLSLDPTPVTDGRRAAAGRESWLDEASATGRAFFTDFIVGYDPDRRRAAVAAADGWARTRGWKWVVLPLTVAALVLAARPLRRRRAAGAAGPDRRTGVGYYDALVAALTAAGRPPRPGETPAEFAAAAEAWLAARGGPAGVPGRVAAAFYAERYAGRATPAAVAAGLAAEVGGLAGTS